MNFFGTQKGNMGEKDETNQEKGSGNRSAKRDVELFPGVSERKTMPMLTATTRQSGGSQHGAPQISMYAPASFDDALDIVESLRGRAAATICLEKMKKTDANRLVDFVAGASAAIDGDFHKLSEQVYIFSPSNIRIVATNKTNNTTQAAKSLGGALDFLYPERAGMDKGAYGSLWNKS